VVWNLLSNAIKFTPRDGQVTVELTQRDGSVTITVRDTGAGIKPEFITHVFERFRQADASMTRRHGGLGLGLAIVRKIVELHGGEIRAHSDGPGCGSRFVVELPLAPAPVLAPAAQRTEQAPRQRVLVVDDNVDAAETLSMLLDAAGHEVEVEHDSRRALERARTAPPDVFLLDIGLPEIDGNELARRLHAQPETAGSVLIAVSGYGQEQDKRAAREAGFRHHLVKPVDFDQLAELLASVHGAVA